MELRIRENTYHLPDVLIVGAAKSGTTSLHHYLRSTPGFFLPAHKEPYFFSFMDAPPAFTSPEPLTGVVHDLADYAALFDDATPGDLLGDASPSYLYTHDTAIANVRRIYGEKIRDLTVIILLRDPVARAWSQVSHFKKFDHEPLPPEEAVRPETIERRLQAGWNIFYDYVGFGRYADQVTAWRDAVPKTRVWLFDDLRSDPAKLVDEVIEFARPGWTERPDNLETSFNISGKPKRGAAGILWSIAYRDNPAKRLAARLVPKRVKDGLYERLSHRVLERHPVTEAFRERLAPVFRDDIERLEGMLGRALSHWTFDA